MTVVKYTYMQQKKIDFLYMLLVENIDKFVADNSKANFSVDDFHIPYHTPNKIEAVGNQIHSTGISFSISIEQKHVYSYGLFD